MPGSASMRFVFGPKLVLHGVVHPERTTIPAAQAVAAVPCLLGVEKPERLHWFLFSTERLALNPVRTSTSIGIERRDSSGCDSPTPPRARCEAGDVGVRSARYTELGSPRCWSYGRLRRESGAGRETPLPISCFPCGRAEGVAGSHREPLASALCAGDFRRSAPFRPPRNAARERCKALYAAAMFSAERAQGSQVHARAFEKQKNKNRSTLFRPRPDWPNSGRV